MVSNVATLCHNLDKCSLVDRMDLGAQLTDETEVKSPANKQLCFPRTPPPFKNSLEISLLKIPVKRPNIFA